MSTDQAAGAEVLERLRDLPGGPEVLRLAAVREDVELVGGAVRDLLLGRTPREIDLVLDGSPASFQDAAVLFARDLVLLLSERSGEQLQVSVHERFGTAVVQWSAGRVDLAARREESYAHPGALPEVRPGTPEQDLERRDFTVNAIAVALGAIRQGAIKAVPQALSDLRAGRLRVLHDRSFQDDPTRLLRLGRYAARLGFEVEPHTARLVAKALATGALARVSDARIGAELRLALGEADLPRSLQTLAKLGVFAALRPSLSLDADLLTDALALLPSDGRAQPLALSCLLREAANNQPDARENLVAALEGWEHPAGEREPVMQAVLDAPRLSEAIAHADAPSELWKLLSGVAVEAVALAGALAARSGHPRGRGAAQRWLCELRHVRLQITGDDLLAAGVQEGPEVGRRLHEALCQRLDGRIAEGREAELHAALGAGV